MNRHIAGLIQKMEGDESEKAHTFKFIASTDGVDRADDIVAQDWDLSGFKGNPVILQNHDHWAPVVGRALEAEVTTLENGRRALVITLQMDGANPHNPDAQRLSRQMADGFVSAGSVGFMPGSVTARSSLNADNAQHGQRGFVLGGPDAPNKLLEFSIVTVPMNAEALAAKSAQNDDARHRKMIREEVRAAIKAERALAAVNTSSTEDTGQNWWQTWEMP